MTSFFRYGWVGVLAAVGLWHGPAFGACQLQQLAQLPVTMLGTQPTITAKINGADAVFLLDSGSFYSVIGPAAAAQFRLHLEPAPPWLRVGGIGGQMSYSVASVDVFTFIGLRLRNIEFIVGGNEVGAGAVGYLGQNILRIADVEYDFANGVVKLMRPKGCEKLALAYWNKAQPFSEIDIEPTSPGMPQAVGTAYLNGKKIRVMFDTGAARSVLARRAAQRAGVKPGDPGVTAAGYSHGVGSAAVPTWIARFDSFKIGDEETRNARLRIGEIGLDVDMLLGADFFLAHHVYIASSQNKVYFTYNGGPVFDLTASGAPPPPGPSTVPTAAPSTAATASAPSTVGTEPTDAAGFGLRGAALAARGQYQLAIADLTRAAQLDPNEPQYFEQRGVAELRLKQPTQALTDFDQAIKLKPDDVAAHLARAQLRFTADDPAGALADLDAVDRSVPKQADVRLTLATDYLLAARYSSAVQQYDQWLATHRDDIAASAALNGRCRARALAAEDLRAALGDCNAAIRTSPNDPMRAVALDTRGLVRLRLGDYAHSLDDYSAALRLQPKLATSLYGRGLDELREGRSSAAQADMQAAQALRPRVADVFRRIGLGP